MIEEYLWTEVYRPHKIADVILPQALKKTFKGFIEKKNIMNMILAGRPGVGKTTVAMALLDELGLQYIVINGSKDGNIDTLRNRISQFASSVSFSGGRKYVIIDEADYLNANSTQPALRNFIEEYSGNCGFIFTCNYPNRILEALQSRCPVVTFKIPKSEASKIAGEIFQAVCKILDTEKVAYEKPVVAELVKKYFPDQRRILNELQTYSASGKIDAGILTKMAEAAMKELMGYLKEKNFTAMRKWVSENDENDPAIIFRAIYDGAGPYVTKVSIPQLVLVLAEYQYKAAFVSDQEINMVACLTDLMVQCEYI